jgi:RNase P protein component
MLPKREKLHGKTVNFLLRKRNVFHGRYFSFFYIRQYPQIKTSQRGFFIPKAIQKSAVKRHVLTRKLYSLSGTPEG